MIKNKVKMILIVLIILSLGLSVGVYAGYTLSSTDVSYTKSNGTSTSVKSALDELYTKVPTHEIGDEVTVGGEQFYVLEWDNNSDTVNLISKYNLNTAGTAQQNDSNDTTGCLFSSTKYWSSSFTSSPFNLNDVIGFTSTDALGKAKSYGRSKGALSSRLLSYEEANVFKSKKDSNTKIDIMYRGTASSGGALNYWLGAVISTDNAYYVSGGFAYDSPSHSGYGLITAYPATETIYGNPNKGVRPVITVLKSALQ